MMKNILIKIGIVIAAYILLTFGYNVIKPMIITDAAMLQLEDSDTSYASYKGIQKAFEFYWVLYILPLVVFFVKK